MNWFEQRIRRYEHRRWTTDDNRMVRPFEWGLEHLEEVASSEWRVASEIRERKGEDPKVLLREYSREVIERSREWYEPAPAADYKVDSEGVLTFTSAIRSPYPENNTVYGQVFRGEKKEPAVLLLPNWNAKWHGQRGLCEWLQRLGITVVKMSMPYHDQRMANGHERADQLVRPKVGLTIQANRQAVQDAKLCLRWLEQEGYTKIGILGTSIGSSVGYITMVHDAGVHAGGFFHVSTCFADV